MDMQGKTFIDHKMKKSLLNIKYLAYLFMILVLFSGIGVSTYYGYKVILKDKSNQSMIIIWLAIIYFVSFMVTIGIKDVLKMLDNLQNGNVFTHENAKIIRIIDKKILFTLLFSVIVNIVMTLADMHNFQFLIIWILFIFFLLAGHILVNPLALLVEKSADLQLEMDLTI
ncbi:MULTISPECIES: DUF2975 domain-containing protein [Helcococcus]|uniref:DUF2975 domain-containing protein n=2 Tax=Helcococcus bovis TaxID=3153252 RepID=A0ABW9F7X9_9FIRM